MKKILAEKEQPSRGQAGRLPVGVGYQPPIGLAQRYALRRSNMIIAFLGRIFNPLLDYMPQAGFEPATHASTEHCAIQLRYWGMYPYFSKG